MTRVGAVGLVVVILAVVFGIAGFRNGRAGSGVDSAAASVAQKAPGTGGSATPQGGTFSSTSSVQGSSAERSSQVTNGAGRPAVGSGRDLTPDELFNQASPAVALVEVRDADMKPVGLGSGFFVSDDGLLVTNYHVIANASFASVRTASAGTMFVEGVAASDRDADLALLKVNVNSVPFLKVSADATAPVGTRVFAIGNPVGLTNTLSEGLVSGVRTFPGRDEPSREQSYLQTSAAISHGSSGGALLTANGVVIGVTTAGIEDGQNLNFAVPADAVRKLIGARGKLQTFASAGAEAIGPHDADAYGAVLTALDHGKFEQAAVLMKNLSERQRNTPAYWFTTGYLHYKLRNIDLSVRAYREAIKLRPEFSAAYTSLGDVYNYQNQGATALEMYRKALKVNPHESRAYRGAGEVLGKLGKFDEAIGLYDKGIALNPADPELLCRKALIQGAMRRFEAAETTYRAALKIDPNRVDTYLYLAETYQTWHKWEQARATYRKVLALQPDNAMAYCQLGVASYNARDAAAAQAAWRSAHRFDPYGQWGGNARRYLQNPNSALIR